MAANGEPLIVYAGAHAPHPRVEDGDVADPLIPAEDEAFPALTGRPSRPTSPGHCPWRHHMSEMPDFNRRRFSGAAAATVAAASLGQLTLAGRLEAMADQSDIRPFKVNVPKEQITDLRSRIKATKWPEREIVTDASQGVQLATVQKLAHYWGTEYDWRKCEAKLNALPQFITEIDGVDIHFIHVRSKHPNALPMIVTHTNMPATVPPDIDKAAFSGAPAPSGLSADEKHAYDQLAFFYKHGLGYANEMANRPQTLYGIGDSPVGMAAWMIDHDASSYALIARVFDGQAEGLTRDDILDNVTLYWVTNTTISSARLYWESHLAFFAPKNVPIPAAVSAFPEELYQAPRSWTEKAYPKLIYYNKLAKGGHFAAWEQPELLVTDLRAAFKPLR